MPSNKKKLIRTIFTANGSCGCGKSKAIENEVHEPIPISKPKTKANPSISKASSTTTSGEPNSAICNDDDDYSSTTTFSEAETTSHLKRSPLMNTVAVEKDSEDPYQDFRHSMLQMIFEKEIDSEEDLQDLLQCFLQLNATCYHQVIIKAFNEICNEAFPCKVSAIAATTSITTEPSPSDQNQFIATKTTDH